MSFRGQSSPRLDALGVTRQPVRRQPGQEVRWRRCVWVMGGVDDRHLNAQSTRCGNYTPLGGMVPLAHDARRISPGGRRHERPTGHGDPGGFIADLMVGRTPEYLGEKIQAPR